MFTVVECLETMASPKSSFEINSIQFETERKETNEAVFSSQETLFQTMKCFLNSN